MSELTAPSAGDVRPDPSGGPGRGLFLAVLAGLGFLLWFAGWGWAIGFVWKKAGLPDYATWGRFYAFWVPVSAFLFALAPVAFALGEPGRAGAVIAQQVRASLSLLLFVLLAIAAPRGTLHVWLGAFFVGFVLVRGAALVWPLRPGASVHAPSRAASLRIFVASALVYALLVPWVLRTLPMAGDEPHYLLISHSILVDRDVDLRNNYEQGDYRSFHPGSISPQAPYAVSAHGVGFPLLLVPGYALGGRLGATWLVALAAALLSLNIYWFCLEVSGSARASLWAWALTALTVPIVTYANQLFPEVPAALGTLYAYRQFRAVPSSGGRGILGGLVATFGVVFLKVRYAPVVFVLWLWLLARPARNRRWAWACGIALLAFLGLFVALDAWVFDGSLMLLRWGDLAAWVAMARPNPFHVIAPLGLLLDQKNGLLAYTPIYVFAFLGLILLARERRPEGLVIPLAGALYLYVLIALSGERWHGEFSPAPRYLVVLVPLLAGPLAVAWHRCRGRAFEVTRAALALWSLAMAATLLVVPRWRFRTKTGQSMVFYMLGQGLSVNLIDWLPSFLVTTAYAYLLAGLGLALVTGVVAYFYALAEK